MSSLATGRCPDEFNQELPSRHLPTSRVASACVTTSTDEAAAEAGTSGHGNDKQRCTFGWRHWRFANEDHTGVRFCADCSERRYHGSDRASDVAIEDAPFGTSLAEPSFDGMGGSPNACGVLS
jgi:hypothetical protein